MAEFSVELRSKLKKAASREEVEALLKADGQDTALSCAPRTARSSLRTSWRTWPAAVTG